jgi:Uncharacterised nucleotidyltransferase
MDTLTKDVPLSQITAALRKTTEFLAHAVARPAAKRPVWTELEWSIACAVAAMQGVSSLLHGSLQWEGPPRWVEFLRDQNEQSITRHQHIAKVLADIDSRARQAGVSVIALKGAALYSKGLYAAGQRPMGDIDLLIQERDLVGTAEILKACGYEKSYLSRRHQAFQPRSKPASLRFRLGEHADNPLKIEVHTKIAESLPVMPFDITAYVAPHQLQAGLNPYSSNAALMMHLLIHAAGNIRARALRLIQLHDIALLAPALSTNDWKDLLDARPSGHGLWWALPPLTLARRYYPNSIDPALLAQLGAGCPRLLRALSKRQLLSDVSWSNIRIAAFPGLEWARSPLEALRFMRSRIVPSREARSELKDGASQVPDESTVPWYGVSHGTRILRWVFTRPPRVQTILSVRAALTTRG